MEADAGSPMHGNLPDMQALGQTKEGYIKDGIHLVSKVDNLLSVLWSSISDLVQNHYDFVLFLLFHHHTPFPSHMLTTCPPQAPILFLNKLGS